MVTNRTLISVLSDAEQFALYGLPDFDDGQRLELCWLVTSPALKSCGRSLGQNLGTQGFCAL